MAFHFSRQKLRPREEESAGELNVVPYLDILMNLIIFMLLSMAGLATLGMVSASAPEIAPPRGDRQGPALTLVVAVAQAGFFIEGAGGRVAIPRKADGRYDFETLSSRMQDLKARFPDENKVVIAADAEVDYQSLVATVDATRETADRRRLFPEVTLAQF
jgi:biopolymer transport protein TolR